MKKLLLSLIFLSLGGVAQLWSAEGGSWSPTDDPEYGRVSKELAKRRSKKAELEDVIRRAEEKDVLTRAVNYERGVLSSINFEIAQLERDLNDRLGAIMAAKEAESSSQFDYIKMMKRRMK